MCTRHNLGSRFRQQHVRLGVIWLSFALVLGFGLVEWGVASRFGILLALPLAVGTYCLLAGSFGVCFYNSMYGRRMADHGAEVVPDESLRKRLIRRGVALAGVSCTLAGLATAVFVVSV
ncbi:MAG TPA: hypothetical protein VMG12_34355 [Polyangiaceae bacterium]|nr:hypothetical protein [Polyangiaceae bacterium]